MTAKVYFADTRANVKQNLLDKLERLFVRSGIKDIVAPKDLVAIKVHFGERGNTAYIRPQFLRRVVDKVKEQGGKPFLTDANTLYVGSRANAVDHLQTAIENGWGYAVVNAPLIIADGLTGKEYTNVEVNLKHFKEVKIGSAALHADAFIAVSHLKGHELTGYGGVLKNIGMGLGSRSGKQMMHSDVKPAIDLEKCTGCRKCHQWCPAGAISMGEDKKSFIAAELCMGCGECTVSCPFGAIEVNWKTEPDVIQEKIAEYTYGVLKHYPGKCGFITFVNNVSPECDCCGWNDAPIVRDIGILASLDPVALDQACIDLINQEHGLPGSRLEGQPHGSDKFRALWPNVDWRKGLEYAESIGLGTRKYELIKI
ncbi:4Fe-4S ferredoxin iron-sulfur binding domain-containing protein [Desulfotomaculum nigrificans CO-1-SRB]|uniref:4Fe-4S ferredoxin iron-sulfur binding domain-containing protein n=1 Tax=Desulfotomaculum nigrificans (strain DSM 14880 / VKM B-2319 / CO-1-SRB) TaxID=868595 RepID=F6B914_DESCC|nr:DUF362 domain-containing protein [Desulfotomaculum nigrificans]AEF93665.1 4Fe-4S ferredoxin iron-sulfur binding domain-containing protein [Desulfotomaculum nigrificans CO-1-SRB]